MSRHAEVRGGRRLAPLVVPWLAYVGVTLVAPALNGAWHRPDFAAHAVVTLGVSGALFGLCLGARYLFRLNSPSRPPGSAAP